jgi:hypothetical protein
MLNSIDDFFETYFKLGRMADVYTDKTPKEMMASERDESGWFTWKPLPGNLSYEDYTRIEAKFGVKFPKSFIEWHKKYFFFDGDCSIVRLPHSNPKEPLWEISEQLDYSLTKELAKLKLYAFAEEGNDAGPLVFDAREEMPDNEYPIRVYDHDFGDHMDGLSEIIFSSFPKLLECLTHFLKETKTRYIFEVLPEFFAIDPEGAGRSGVDYWLSWAKMDRENQEYFSKDDE